MCVRTGRRVAINPKHEARLLSKNLAEEQLEKGQENNEKHILKERRCL